MAHQTATHLSLEAQRCIDECLHCFATCEATITHCLQMGGRHAEAAYIRLLTDCATICQLAADYMLRGSDFHTRLCAICAEVCGACAEACQRGDPKDQMMKDCAAQCRSCADSCERMTRAA